MAEISKDPIELAREIRQYLAEGWSGPRDAKLLAAAADFLAVPLPDDGLRELAMQALNEQFDCGAGVIGLGPLELRHLTATKATGTGLLDWQKLTLGEIVDCLADAGLLAAPRELR